MSPARATLASLLFAGSALAPAACHDDGALRRDAPVAAPAPAAAPSAMPVDHLAADELVEGEKKAFGLVLPRDLQVDGSFADVVLASGHVAVHPLAKYFRARLTEGSFREGDEAASFEHVHMPSTPGKDYSVRILPSVGTTRVEVRDTTPKPLPSMPDDAARWRQAGLTPKGRLLDPLHTE